MDDVTLSKVYYKFFVIKVDNDGNIAVKWLLIIKNKTYLWELHDYCLNILNFASRCMYVYLANVMPNKKNYLRELQ